MASITLRSEKGSPLSNAEVDSNFSNLNTELGLKEVAANKGVAGGYASLDGSGKVPSTQLPSYVDDVVEAANFLSLPGTGETGKIYVVLDTNKSYRWSGSAYIEIASSPGSTDAIPEGSTNLYFTNARARAAISATGSLSYNSSTGVLSYTAPTLLSQFTNDPGYITSSALSSYLPLSGGTLTGALRVQGLGTSNPTTADGTDNSILSLRATDALVRLQFGTRNTGNYAGWIQASYDNGGGANGVEPLELNPLGGTVNANGNAVLHAGNYNSYALPLSGGTLTGVVNATDFRSQGQIRATGWYNVNSGTHTGLGTEIGVSGGSSYILSYNRNTGDYGTLEFNAANIRLVPIGGALTGPSGNAILHAGNYNSYAPTLTGGNASGTWNISVTGGANTLFLQSLGSGSVNVNTGGTAVYRTDAGNGSAVNYAPVLHVGGGDTMWQAQGTYGTSGDGTFYFRQGYNGSWGNWLTMLSSANYSSYALPLSGGTITGLLTMSGFANPHITLRDSGGNYSYIRLWDGSSSGYLIKNVSSGTGNGMLAGSLYLYTDESKPVQIVHAGTSNATFLSGGDVYVRGQIYAAGNGTSTGSQVLHAGNYSSYALPLSGGTISGTVSINGGGSQPLNLTTSSSSPWGFGLTRSDAGVSSKIFLHNGSGSWAWVYEHNPVFYNGGAYSQFLHSGNYSSYALPLSGGTLTSNLTMSSGGIGSNAWSAASANETSRILAPAGAAASWDNNPVGAIKIRLPFRYNNAMWRMTVKIYDYGASVSEYHIGTYSYADGGYQSAAYFIGSNYAPVRNVRFGNDGSYDCVWIGETNTVWSYPVVAVTDFSSGFRTSAASNFMNNWHISYVTSFGTVAQNLNPVVRLASGSHVDGNTILHAGNYTSYSPSLTGSGASGTWGIRITGFANQGTARLYSTDASYNYDAANPYFGYLTYNGNTNRWRFAVSPATPAAVEVAYADTAGEVTSSRFNTTSGSYNNANTWIQFGSSGGYGLYFPGSGAMTHFYPNSPSTYGSAFIEGSKNSYWGIMYNTGAGNAGWMTNGNTTGFYNHSYGWKYYHESGRFYSSDSTYGAGNTWSMGLHNTQNPVLYSATSGAMGLLGVNSSGSYRWQIYGDGGAYGFLQSAWGAWDIQKSVNGQLLLRVSSTDYTALHSGNYTSYALPLSGGTLSGDITFSNGRKGLVGVYDPAQTQAVWAMGSAYVLTNGGGSATYGNFYGLGWSYEPNYGGSGNNPQSKSGLGHQLLVMWAGVTRTAIGTGIWTDGSITATGNVTAYSDERLKKDWSPIHDGFVDRLAVIRAGTYTRIDSGERQAGVSAQAMREILPEVVSEDNDGTLALAYGNAALVSAVELAKEIVALKREIEALKSKLH